MNYNSVVVSISDRSKSFKYENPNGLLKSRLPNVTLSLVELT